MGDRRTLTSSKEDSDACHQHCNERDVLQERLSDILRKQNVRLKRYRDKKKREQELQKEREAAHLARRQVALDKLEHAAAGLGNPRNIV